MGLIGMPGSADAPAYPRRVRGDLGRISVCHPAWRQPGATLSGGKPYGSKRHGLLRGLYSTLGTATTDSINTGIKGNNTTGLSWLVIANQLSTGGGGFGRIVTHNDQHIWTAAASSNLGFQLGANAPLWTIPQLTAAVSCNVITYAGGSADPKMWRDGVQQTVTYASGTRSGAISSITSQAIWLGNRASDSGRGHDGAIGLFIQFDSVLPDALARELSLFPAKAFAADDSLIWLTDAGGGALQTISPSAIASGEAFGTAVVGRGAVAVAPTAIASGEAFGTAVVGRGAVAVAPTAIASGEAFGTAVVSGGAIVVAPTGIASAEAFGTAVVGRGAVAVAPTGIASGEAFGTATLRNGSTVSAVAIASAEAFGTAVVTPGGVIVSPPSIDSGQAFGTATVGDGSTAVLAAPRLRPAAAGAARPARVQSGRRAPNLSASRRSWR